MIKKLFYVVLGILLLSVNVQAKEEKSKKGIKKEAYHAVWQKLYGGDDDDIAYDIVALEDGDSAIVGTCKSYGAQRTDICVTRMTAKGDMKWRLWIGGKKKDEGKAISRAADGSILVLGSSKSFSKEYDYDLLVAKVSLEGKLVWQKNLGGARDEFAGGIAGTDDGGALIVGDSESYGDGDKGKTHPLRFSESVLPWQNGRHQPPAAPAPRAPAVVHPPRPYHQPPFGRCQLDDKPYRHGYELRPQAPHRCRHADNKPCPATDQTAWRPAAPP